MQQQQQQPLQQNRRQSLALPVVGTTTLVSRPPEVPDPLVTTLPPPLPPLEEKTVDSVGEAKSTTPPQRSTEGEMSASSSTSAVGVVRRTSTSVSSGSAVSAGRVRSALEHRKLAYKELTFDTMLMYHRTWLQQAPQARPAGCTSPPMPDAATLDTRGDDLPLERLQAAAQSKSASVASAASAAIAGDRNLLHVDRYVFCFDTKAPPADWADVLPHLVALHEPAAGALLVDLALAPKSGFGSKVTDERGFTWMTALVDEAHVHYARCALDLTLECSTYLLDAGPWLRGEALEQCEGAERLVAVSGGMRHFRRFPSEEPAVLFRRFMLPVNPKLVQEVASRCLLLTVVDHVAGRRDWVPRMFAKVLRNRHKPDNPQSRSKGLNHYVPAIQCLRRENDECQRLTFVRGLQACLPSMNIKDLLQMPLDELRIRYLTFQAS